MRKRLARLVGKSLEYTATVGNTAKTNSHICLTDIKHNNKMVADHLWCSRAGVMEFKEGDHIMFKASVNTYTDTKGERKCGIHSMCSVVRYDESIHDSVHNEYKHINKRMSTKWH